MPKKERIQEIQFFRALAFLAVVFQHTYGALIQDARLNPINAIFLSVIFLLSKFAVPAFVFITGMVLFYNYYDQIHYIAFIKKRLQDIMVPFLVWSLFYYFFSHAKNTFFNLKHVVALAVTGHSSYHLWFVIMIFQFYLLFPVFRLSFKWLERLFESRPVFSMFLVGVVYAGITWIALPVLFGWADRRPASFVSFVLKTYQDRNFIYWWYYFVLGGMAGLWIGKWRHFVHASRWWNLGVFFAGLGVSGYQLLTPFLRARVPVNVYLVTNFQPVMTIFSISSILLIYQFSIWLGKKGSPSIQKSFQVIGRFSYGAYLCHAFVLNYAYRAVFAEWTQMNLTLQMLMVALICSIGSLVLPFVFSQTMLAKWLFGVSASGKQTLISNRRS